MKRKLIIAGSMVVAVALVLALASYNAGLGKVQKWYIQNPLIGMEIADIPYEETRNYVKEVENTYEWLKKIQRIKERLHPKF
jgi:soluble lytic murein transglycosylase-like protein